MRKTFAHKYLQYVNDIPKQTLNFTKFYVFYKTIKAFIDYDFKTKNAENV